MDAKSAIQIGLVVGLLFSLVAAYLSGKTWQWAQVILVFLIFVAGGVFWYLSAAVLKAHHSYREVANKLESHIHEFEVENAALQYGTKDEKVLANLAEENIRIGANLRDVRHDLGILIAERGSVWIDVQPDRIEADGTVHVNVERPDPHNWMVGC